MAKELVTMSTKEIDRADVMRRVLEKRLTQVKAGRLLGLSKRQVRRLRKVYERDGVAGLASRKRGRPSNRRLNPELQERVVGLVRALYGDFGPKLAHEKLTEAHAVRVGRETVRKWLIGAGIWQTRSERMAKAHQPRHRRQCLGELVQIDGCEHAWFEDRGPCCTLLVYVDDATGQLMELRFVKSESAFDYFAATTSYVVRHGKPVAFYSDKHSVFRVNHEGTTGRSKGVSQFGRALAELNIEIICANSPQAKGRVERMNKTLQDRLVKELRLRGISTIDAGNAFAPEFMGDYNERFARAAINPHNAHRPLHGGEDLSRIFTWQEDRVMTRNLVVHFKRTTYLVEPGAETLELAGRSVRVHEWEDGRVEIHHGGRRLPCAIFEEHQRPVTQGDVVENKRLGAILSVIQAAQDDRDQARLTPRKLTIRQKDRLRARSAQARAPLEPSAPAVEVMPTNLPTPASADRLGAVVSFLKNFEAEQKLRKKERNLKANQRKRDREMEALRASAPPAAPNPGLAAEPGGQKPRMAEGDISTWAERGHF